jgi:hypothetical protein
VVAPGAKNTPSRRDERLIARADKKIEMMNQIFILRLAMFVEINKELTEAQSGQQLLQLRAD